MSHFFLKILLGKYSAIKKDIGNYHGDDFADNYGGDHVDADNFDGDDDDVHNYGDDHDDPGNYDGDDNDTDDYSYGDDDAKKLQLWRWRRWQSWLSAPSSHPESSPRSSQTSSATSVVVLISIGAGYSS